ncbi:MAG: trypsin-like peptidase domain-containing protein [Betaproteobacteria bacterium]|nr:trypsin-like peptidase domain-containing protein [Betaproteobacteria bacterium]
MTPAIASQAIDQKLKKGRAFPGAFGSFAAPVLVFCLGVLGNSLAHAQRSPEGLPAHLAPQAASKAESLPVPSAPARDLYAKYRDRLVQVRLLLKSASEQSIAGSGFVVQADDGKGALLVTNYHVVSALAIDPAKYRIELRQTNDAVAEAELIAIDVAHDLAVLRTRPAAKTDASSSTWRAKVAFDLRDTLPAQGERLYSLGHPMGVAFLISEGIFNGLKEQQLYDHMVFSGALNPGMSGGPAIDANGRVAGVNVSGLRNAQLLNFLVPVSHARALIAKAKDSAPRNEWRTEIAQQLLAHQEVFTAKLFGAKDTAVRPQGFGSQQLAGRAVQTLDDSLTRCNASANTGDGVRYRRESLACQMKSGVYVHGTMQTGAVVVGHNLYTNVSLATPQFLNMRGGRPYVAWMDQRGGGEKTREECHDAFLRGAQREYRVSMCTNAYRKFPGLYDITVRAVQTDDARQHLESRLHVSGVSWDNGQKIAKAFVERLQ